jgi:hypothetical protein
LSATWIRQTIANPPDYSPQALNLVPLNVVPGAVGTMAYGRYNSPEYMVHPGEYIPAVGTLAGTPPVQAINAIYFTLYLPAGTKPAGGWPVAILSGGSSTNKHILSTFAAAKLAQHGIAAIGINHVGQGFGPLTQLQITKTDGTLVFPDAAAVSIRTVTTSSARSKDRAPQGRARGRSRNATPSGRRSSTSCS